jgi:putative ABC transport system permease protein
MRILRVLVYRLRALWSGDRLDAEAREEIASHVERQTAFNIATGMSPAEARRAAILDVGQVPQLGEACRDARGLGWWDALRGDLRYGLRQIRKVPGFSLAAIATLALGIGATSAVFAVFDAVLLRPLPFSAPDRLYSLYEVNSRANIGRTRATPLNFLDWQQQATSFSGMAAHIGTGFTLTGSGEPAFTLGQVVTPNFLDVLGVQPMLGRRFRPEETEAGRHRVAILNHALWLMHYGGDSSIVGRTALINGEPYLIVGVMPPTFSYPSDAYQLMTPFVMKGTVRGGPPISRSSRYLRVIGRLSDNATEDSAREELSAVGRRLADAYPDANGTVAPGMTRLADDLTAGAESNLVIVLTCVGFVLLIACVNVAGLTIARGSARGRELAVRAAIGASRGRLVRQLATEGLLLFVIGGHELRQRGRHGRHVGRSRRLGRVAQRQGRRGLSRHRDRQRLRVVRHHGDATGNRQLHAQRAGEQPEQPEREAAAVGQFRGRDQVGLLRHAAVAHGRGVPYRERERDLHR